MIQGSNKSKILFGIIIIAIGILLLLNSTGVANLDRLLDWWPTLIILIGVWRLVARRFRKLFFPILLIVIGVILQLYQLAQFNLGAELGKYWPILLIAVGIAIFAGSLRRRAKRQRGSPSSRNPHSAIIDVEPTTPASADRHILDVSLGSQDRTIHGDFRGGDVNVVMGSGALDLRDSKIVDKPAILQVSIVMGEAKIRVPNEWNVHIENSSQMGDAKDTRHSKIDSNNPDLIIRGSVTMASLQITD